MSYKTFLAVSVICLPAWAFAQEHGQADVMVPMSDVMVPMSDGVKLATDIYVPEGRGAEGKGHFPTVLMRTPYNKTVRAATFADFFTKRGYAVVVQDVRGRYKSQGHWRPLNDDGKDGYDTTNWIGKQSWSDQRVGTVGTSYEGGTQHAMAISRSPNLKAMVPLFAMSNLGSFGMRYEGAFELRWMNWVFSMGDPGGPPNKVAAARAAADPTHAPELAQLSQHVADYLQLLPLRPGETPLRYAPDYEHWLIAAMEKGGADPFYTDMGVEVVKNASVYADVPVYHVTGWYDCWGHQVADMNYPTLRDAKRSPQRLIVGPWTHSRQNANFAGDAEFTADAAIDLNEFEARWFDHWLKGMDNVESDAPVKIYVMGGGDGHRTPEGRIFVGGHWRDEREWPLARTQYTAYYLGGDRSLSVKAPGFHAPLTYDFDPKHPVPTLGGNISSQGSLTTAGATDQRCVPNVGPCKSNEVLADRKDVLVFQTEPLTDDLEVTGPLEVKLWAATDGTDTDFTAKLVDVYPRGPAFNIGDGIVRARYRNGAAEQLLEPGKPYELGIRMYPTSLVFKKGHRIRVDISSSNFPRFDTNPNTGEPLNNNHEWRVAKNTVFVDETHPSRLILPVIPAK